jgi:hypothetical protein
MNLIREVAHTQSFLVDARMGIRNYLNAHFANQTCLRLGFMAIFGVVQWTLMDGVLQCWLLFAETSKLGALLVMLELPKLGILHIEMPKSHNLCKIR